ncbi:SGNH/GDSL hydrolase family protein [Neobacillus niacini]|uniref:SGNH/GDSL hydrolase family protein n=1 Tax=Neobacillus niacini TaxID=86668 RepID=UPI002858ACCE|nr:SGNH/GDSL hydrolase family protein [Neobacillus niacini]MDR7002198.1 hypothetical protein [Neobacillus niacini]
MKNFLTILLGIICVAVLFFGYSNYQQKIEAASKKALAVNEKTEPSNLQDFDHLTKNWPDQAAKQFKHRLDQKKPFKLFLIGSEADSKGTYQEVKKKLDEAFGEHIKVSVLPFKGSSTDYISQDNLKELANKKPDLIVLEPFLLKDNGVVAIEDTLDNVTHFIEQVKKENRDTSFVLQPSYPIYQANFYPNQVAELKNYAKENEIPFLDHWSAWPDYHKKELNDYLLPDESGPNEKGIHVWSGYLLHYLMNSESES